MIYTNEKLDIRIENSEYFKITERENCIHLMFNGKNRFVVFAGSIIRFYDESTVYACDESTVYAHGKSKVYACDESTVYAHGKSKVYACDKSAVYAKGSSQIYTYDNSLVYAGGFSCVYRKSAQATIKKENHFGTVINQIFKVKKRTVVYKKLEDDLIAVLELDKGQMFQSENHSKCRTDRAIVVAIENIDGTQKFDRGVSINDFSFIYEVGKTVSAPYEEYIKECSGGIHFFLSRRSAERADNRHCRNWICCRFGKRNETSGR